MKISPVSNHSINNNKKQSFTGVADTLVNFWQFVDNGGRAMQFTVEDMFGTNFPRTYKGAMAGYKYTKKINIQAIKQEGLREFLTGPTMCVMPVAILGLAKKIAGKSADTHISNIKNLSYLMNQTQFNSKETVDKDFITTVINDALEQTTKVSIDKINKEDTQGLIESILKYKNFKGDKKEKAELLSKVESIFEEIVKKNKESYIDTDFASVSYTKSKGQVDSTKFKNYVNYMISYIDDFSNKFLKGENSLKNITEANINKFKTSLCGNRGIVIASMIGITGLLMSLIPKIYTWASGSVNPNAKEVYAEAKKNGGRA